MSGPGGNTEAVQGMKEQGGTWWASWSSSIKKTKEGSSVLAFSWRYYENT